MAGGRSSRFGRDKALYSYAGKPLAAWALGSMCDADEQFIVSSRPYDFGVPVHPDLYSGSSLGGLHAALTHAAYSWVAVAACDMPFLTRDYWKKLLDYLEDAQAVVVVGPEGRLEPLAAFYHKSSLPLAEQQLRENNLKIQTFIDRARARVVPWDQLGVDARTFANVNRPLELP